MRCYKVALTLLEFVQTRWEWSTGRYAWCCTFKACNLATYKLHMTPRLPYHSFIDHMSCLLLFGLFNCWIILFNMGLLYKFRFACACSFWNWPTALIHDLTVHAWIMRIHALCLAPTTASRGVPSLTHKKESICSSRGILHRNSLLTLKQLQKKTLHHILCTIDLLLSRDRKTLWKVTCGQSCC